MSQENVARNVTRNNLAPYHKYLNDTILALSNEYVSFKPKIENYFEIADMNIDKYRGLTILMNEYYLNKNEKLMNLLSSINDKIKNIIYIF